MNKTNLNFIHFSSDNYGGSDFSLFELISGLDINKFNLIICLGKNDPMISNYENLGIKVYTLRYIPPRNTYNPFLFFNFILNLIPTVIQLCRIIIKEKVDIVHVNTSLNLQGAIAAKLTQRPLLWHVREIGGTNIFSDLIRRCVCLFPTKIIAISKAVCDHLKYYSAKPILIYNAINIENYKNSLNFGGIKSELGIENYSKIVTTIGRLEFWKGQHIFIESIPQILKIHPNTKFLIVGGPAKNKLEYNHCLQKRCEELKIQNSVIFTGLRNDINKILSLSSLLVLPSVMAEPFGRTVIESMAAGCPVIATAAGGPLEIVLNDETGFLVPPNDSNAIANRVNKLLSDPLLASSFAEKGKKRAFQHFSLERLVNDFEDLIKTVLNE